MMFDFGEWITKVAADGVIRGSFSREWAAMQLANHYSRDRITADDIARFDAEMDEYEKEMSEQFHEELVNIDAE